MPYWRTLMSVARCRVATMESPTVIIRPFNEHDAEPVVTLSLLAWEPVFASFEQVLGPEIYRRVYPDWKLSQREAVLDLCTSAKTDTWVADLDGTVLGFILWELYPDRRSAEVHMLAVHPYYQNHGIGTQLNLFALDHIKQAGMTLAEVATGGDPGHAPARRTYEKSGYTPLPLIRYYKVL